MRDRPYGNANFLVDFGTGDPRSATAGFSEVIFPTFTMASGAPLQREPLDTSPCESPCIPVCSPVCNALCNALCKHLVLKRGVTGTLDLYAWWNKARRGKAPQRRTVKIELLSEDRSTVVMTWRFRNVRPVSLSYSPLRASEGGIVMETVELSFDGVEVL